MFMLTTVANVWMVSPPPPYIFLSLSPSVGKQNLGLHINNIKMSVLVLGKNRQTKQRQWHSQYFCSLVSSFDRCHFVRINWVTNQINTRYLISMPFDDENVPSVDPVGGRRCNQDYY